MRCPVCSKILSGTSYGLEVHYRFKHPERTQLLGRPPNPKPSIYKDPVILYTRHHWLAVKNARLTKKGGGQKYRTNPTALKTFRHRRRTLAQPPSGPPAVPEAKDAAAAASQSPPAPRPKD